MNDTGSAQRGEADDSARRDKADDPTRRDKADDSARRDKADDATLVRNQSALRTPNRWVWLVPGLLLAIAALITFAVLLPVNLALAWIGIAFVTASAIGLVVTGLAIREDRPRNVTLATLMTIMAVMAIVLLLAILWSTQLPEV